MNCLITFLMLCHLDVAVARFGFVKDQSMDAVFPGPVYRQSSSLPEGHMRPLGWQRRPDAPIAEEPEMPGTREFYEKFVSTDKPVVFRHAITQTPAFTKWSEDDYLTEKYGHLNVTVRVKVARKQSKIKSEEKVIKFKKFLYDYMYDNLYLASILPKEMMSDLPLPKCVRCGTINENLISAQLWMSSGGTSSRVHSHDDHLLHCVLFGRRDFILIEDVHKRAFAYIDDYPGSLGGHSDIDTERVNVFDFKNILRVPWIWATLFPGDCLFVPAGYLHQVRSYGRSVSITLEFFRIKEFDDTGCQLIEEEFVPLSDAYYLLTFDGGRLRLSDLKLDVEKLRHILISLTDMRDVLTSDKFENFYKQILGEGGQLPSAKSVFDLLKSTKQAEHITKADLLNLQSSSLQKVVDIINNEYAEIVRKEQKLALEEAAETTSEASQLMHEEF